MNLFGKSHDEEKEIEIEIGNIVNNEEDVLHGDSYNMANEDQNIEDDQFSIAINNSEIEEPLTKIEQSVIINEPVVEEQTPIQKVLNYIKSPIREDSNEIIESMIELSSSLETIGVEAHELTSILSETEKTRLKMLQEQTKLGLVESQYPIGFKSVDSIKPVAFVYSSKTKLNEIAKKFSLTLEDISRNYENENIDKALHLHSTLKENKIDPKNHVLNKDQKNSYYKLVMKDDRISRTEFEYILNFMKSSAFANSKIIKQRDQYYKSNLNTQDKEFPNIKPLIEDVKKLKSTLNVKLEDIPLLMTPQEKKNLENFLPALDEYYKDQVAAFSGGKCYLPLAKNLKEIQDNIKKNADITSLIKNSESLGFTMQRLYILHWIAESLMKKQYKTTLGKAIGKHTEKYPDKKSTYKPLLEAVIFRNNIAHNGIVWNPDDFEKYIENYEYGIKLISDDLKIDLKKFQLQKINKVMKPAEIEKEISKKLGLTIEQIKEIDPTLLQSINSLESPRYYRLKNMLKTLNKDKISIDNLFYNDSKILKKIYNSKLKVVDEITKKLGNNYFTELFANKYFNMSFPNLISSVKTVRSNSNDKAITGWLFKLAMIEKEGKIDNDNIRTINELKAELNG